MGALAYLRAGLPEHHPIDLRLAMQLDARPAVFLVAEAESDILEACRQTDAAFHVRFWWLLDLRSVPAVRIASPAASSGSRLNHFSGSDRPRRRRTNAKGIAFVQYVAHAQLNRIQAQRLCQFIHLH